MLQMILYLFIEVVYYLVIMNNAAAQFTAQFADDAAYDQWNGTNGTTGYSWLDGYEANNGFPVAPDPNAPHDTAGAFLEPTLGDDVTAAAAATPHVAVPMNPLSVQARGSNSPTELDMRGWS